MCGIDLLEFIGFFFFRIEARDNLWSSEGASAGQLLLCGQVLGLGTVKDFQEGRHFGTHARMHVRLGAFDVIVNIIPENLHSRNGFLPDRASWVVVREQD